MPAGAVCAAAGGAGACRVRRGGRVRCGAPDGYAWRGPGRWVRAARGRLPAVRSDGGRCVSRGVGVAAFGGRAARRVCRSAAPGKGPGRGGRMLPPAVRRSAVGVLPRGPWSWVRTLRGAGRVHAAWSVPAVSGEGMDVVRPACSAPALWAPCRTAVLGGGRGGGCVPRSGGCRRRGARSAGRWRTVVRRRAVRPMMACRPRPPPAGVRVSAGPPRTSPPASPAPAGTRRDAASPARPGVPWGLISGSDHSMPSIPAAAARAAPEYGYSTATMLQDPKNRLRSA